MVIKRKTFDPAVKVRGVVFVFATEVVNFVVASMFAVKEPCHFLIMQEEGFRVTQQDCMTLIVVVTVIGFR